MARDKVSSTCAGIIGVNADVWSLRSGSLALAKAFTVGFLDNRFQDHATGANKAAIGWASESEGLNSVVVSCSNEGRTMKFESTLSLDTLVLRSNRPIVAPRVQSCFTNHWSETRDIPLPAARGITGLSCVRSTDFEEELDLAAGSFCPRRQRTDADSSLFMPCALRQHLPRLR